MKPIITYEALFGSMVNTSPSRPVQFQSNLTICEMPKGTLKELEEKFQLVRGTVPLHNAAATSRIYWFNAKGSGQLVEYLKTHSKVRILATPAVVNAPEQEATITVNEPSLHLTVLHQVNLPAREKETTVNLKAGEHSMGFTIGNSLEEPSTWMMAGEMGDQFRVVIVTVSLVMK